jgi:hypothetical protein
MLLQKVFVLVLLASSIPWAPPAWHCILLGALYIDWCAKNPWLSLEREIGYPLSAEVHASMLCYVVTFDTSIGQDRTRGRWSTYLHPPY